MAQKGNRSNAIKASRTEKTEMAKKPPKFSNRSKKRANGEAAKKVTLSNRSDEEATKRTDLFNRRNGEAAKEVKPSSRSDEEATKRTDLFNRSNGEAAIGVKPCNRSHGEANVEAAKEVKPSNRSGGEATKRKDLFNRSNGEAAKKVKLSNRSDGEVTKRTDLFNQINGEAAKEVKLSNRSDAEATKCAILSRFQQQQQKKKAGTRNKGKKIVVEMELVDHQHKATEVEDILVEILSRLPVRSLVRFKCVSKFWETLISKPYFKRMHLNNLDQNSQRLLFVQLTRPRLKYCSSSLSSSTFDFEDVQELDGFIIKAGNYSYTTFCGLDGLVLLGFTDREFDDKPLFLWNPSTRECTRLPHTDYTLLQTSFGLGYDSKADDYKILKLHQPGSGWSTQSLEILSLKSGSWRKVCNYPTAFCPNKKGHTTADIIVPVIKRSRFVESFAFVNGAFHWLCRGVFRDLFLVSFSASNEVYGDVPLLDQMIESPKDTAIDRGIWSSEGMLCFYSTHTRLGWGTFRLWVMKDYGVKESWALVFTTGMNQPYLVIPKYMFPDGEVLFYKVDEHHEYWTSKGPYGLRPWYLMAIGIVYRQSLISPRLLI